MTLKDWSLLLKPRNLSVSKIFSFKKGFAFTWVKIKSINIKCKENTSQKEGLEIESNYIANECLRLDSFCRFQTPETFGPNLDPYARAFIWM